MKQPLLSVKRKLWRQDDDHAILHDDKYKAVREKVLIRDKYTCSHCEFKFNHYQEVHHSDDDHSNQSDENLTTICGLCHQVYHLGMTALRGSGFIAFIPELTQTQVNSLARTIFMQMNRLDESSSYLKKVQGLYGVFQERGSDTLKKVFYHGDKNKLDTSQPMVLAQYLSLCSDEEYENRAEKLSGFVVVPTVQAFRNKQLEDYSVMLGSDNNKIDNYFEIFNSLISNGRNL
ncbi:HNH endonuclease [Serratia symbiotica]|uniref:HNH endonuclease n=1 Tax=Serratia symbiotica TaxID=138074 RepID=UPI0013294D33|nr:HNH endonuclease [Serratia symbiotica]QTP13330.1 HNH endonuclease [Serratia symbiotica]